VWLFNLVPEADEENHDRWTPRTWEGLRKKRGRLITNAARNGSKNAWRNYTPPLPHEKPEPNRTDHRIIVGLAGIQAGLADGEIRFDKLSTTDAELAARYAVHELNGFAPWLPELTKHHSAVVRDVLTACIKGEWAFDPTREHPYEVIQRLVWHGEGLTDLMCETLLVQIRTGEPRNITILRCVLTLLLTQSQAPYAELASLASRRAQEQPVGTPAFIVWLSVWLQLDAAPALEFLRTALQRCENPDAVVVAVCGNLISDRAERSPLIANPDYARSSNLRMMIPLVYRHVKLSDDLHRENAGVFSPGDRDHAQDFRNGLVARLAQSEEPEAEVVLRELLAEPALEHQRDWILNLLDRRAEQQADSIPWTPHDIRTFARDYEIDPKSDRELFSLACRRLTDIMTCPI
jgi:hypothetical protein